MADPSPAPDVAARKAELRGLLRGRRRAWVDEIGRERKALEEAAGRSLLARLGEAGVIAFTRALGAELDPAAALALASDAGRVTALPVLLPDGGRLAFHRWRPGDRLRPGPHGIEEPAEPSPVDPDLIVLPLIGFDRRCGRLGQGGGYFDRTLAALPNARRIGLAWACQEVEAVPMEAWDLPLEAVQTEREWIPCL